MTANDSNSYFGNLNKLVDEYDHLISYHHSFGKKPIDVEYSALTEKIKSSHRAPKFKFGDRVRITNYQNIFSKDYTKNWSKNMCY